MVLGWVIGGVVVLVIIIIFVYYNRFVRLSQIIDNSTAQINVQLKKRADLVPNLLESVKGYMKHERKIFEDVTAARKAMVGAKTLDKKMKAGNELQAALGNLFAIAENYPNLRANENFLQFQQELAAIEDKVAYARQYYNAPIMSYNVMTNTIPGMWFAAMFGFKAREYFNLPEAEKAVPKVKFE